MTQTINAAFNANLLNLIAPFAAVKDIRFYLCGFNIQKHPSKPGVLLCATNGHQLALAYDPTGETDAEYTLPTYPGLLVALRAKGADWCTYEGERLIIRSHEKTGPEQFVCPRHSGLAGKFPDYRRLMPANPSELVQQARPWVQGSYLERVGKVASALNRNRRNGFCGISFLSMPQKDGEDNGAIFARYSIEPNVMVMTMPLREDGAPTWPTWL